MKRALAQVALFLALSFPLLLIACAGMPPATGPLYQAPPPRPGSGIVVIYRISEFDAGAAESQLLADGRGVGTVRNASYTWAYAEPGRHGLLQTLVNCENVPLNVDVDAGQTLYLRADFEFHVFLPRRCTLVDVPASEALQELASLHSLGEGQDITR